MKTFLLLVSFTAISTTTAFAEGKPACEERNLSPEDLQQCLSDRANAYIDKDIILTGVNAGNALVYNTLGNGAKEDATRLTKSYERLLKAEEENAAAYAKKKVLNAKFHQMNTDAYIENIEHLKKGLAKTKASPEVKSALRAKYFFKGLAAVSVGLGAYEGWRVYDGIANAPADVVDSHNFAAKQAASGVMASDKFSAENEPLVDNVDAK